MGFDLCKNPEDCYRVILCEDIAGICGLRQYSVLASRYIFFVFLSFCWYSTNKLKKIIFSFQKNNFFSREQGECNIGYSVGGALRKSPGNGAEYRIYH